MSRFIINAFGVTVALFFCQSVIAGGLPEGGSDDVKPVYSEQSSNTQALNSNTQALKSKNQTSTTSTS